MFILRNFILGALVMGLGCSPIALPTAPTVVLPPPPAPITQIAVSANAIPHSADADIIVKPFLASGALAIDRRVECRSTVGYFEPATFDYPSYTTRLRNATVPTAIECEADGIIGRTSLDRRAWAVTLLAFENGFNETSGRSALTFSLTQDMRDVPAVFAVVAWGDGVVEPVTGALQTGSFTMTHRYQASGLFPVRVEVAWSQGNNQANALYMVR